MLKGNGKEVAKHAQPSSIAFLQVADETFDVGVDTRTGVNDADDKVPFAFTGKIHMMSFKLGSSQMLPADKKAAAEAGAKVND